MPTSGTTKLSTSGDGPLTLLATSATNRPGWVLIDNESGIEGYFSVNGGIADADKIHMPASPNSPATKTWISVPMVSIGYGVLFWRVASGSNVTGLSCSLL